MTLLWRIRRPVERIRRNRARCRSCRGLVEAPSDPVQSAVCRCGALRVSGGLQWLSRGYDPGRVDGWEDEVEYYG